MTVRSHIEFSQRFISEPPKQWIVDDSKQCKVQEDQNDRTGQFFVNGNKFQGDRTGQLFVNGNQFLIRNFSVNPEQLKNFTKKKERRKFQNPKITLTQV